MSMERDEVARKVLDVSLASAYGYRREAKVGGGDASEKCAVAASNVGYFICQSLGLSHDEIKAIVDDLEKTAAASKRD